MPANITLFLQGVPKEYPPRCIQNVQRMVSLSICRPSAHPYRLGGLEALGTAVAAGSVPPRLLSALFPLLLLSSLFEPRLGRKAPETFPVSKGFLMPLSAPKCSGYPWWGVAVVPPAPHTRDVPRTRLADGSPAASFTSFFGLGFLFFLRRRLHKILLPQCVTPKFCLQPA